MLSVAMLHYPLLRSVPGDDSFGGTSGSASNTHDESADPYVAFSSRTVRSMWLSFLKCPRSSYVYCAISMYRMKATTQDMERLSYAFEVFGNNTQSGKSNHKHTIGKNNSNCSYCNNSLNNFTFLDHDIFIYLFQPTTIPIIILFSLHSR